MEWDCKRMGKRKNSRWCWKVWGISEIRTLNGLGKEGRCFKDLHGLVIGKDKDRNCCERRVSSDLRKELEQRCTSVEWWDKGTCRQPISQRD